MPFSRLQQTQSHLPALSQSGGPDAGIEADGILTKGETTQKRQPCEMSSSGESPEVFLCPAFAINLNTWVTCVCLDVL